MRLRVDGYVRTGRAVDARALPVDGPALAAAIRGAASPAVVDAPDPGPVHERVGHVHPGIRPRVKTVLAEAARSRGCETPVDDDLAAARDRLEAIDVPDPPSEVERARRRSAERRAEAEGLDERVAELRGRIKTRRERGLDTEALEAELAAAARKLSEAETERLAARERLDGTTETLRSVRDARERRMRVQDEVANLEREARAHLVAAVREPFADAVASAPGPTPTDPFDADGVTAALAVARVADLRAPVVLDCDRFRTPAAAASWLDTPVVRL